MGRDSSRRKRGMGGGSSEEEKRDSSLRGPARKQRAQEKTGPLRSEWRAGLGGAGYPDLTAFVALRVRPEGLTYDCDARPALQSGWRDELAATRDAERFLPTRPGAQTTRARKYRAAPLGMTGWSGARDAQPLQASSLCESGLKA